MFRERTAQQTQAESRIEKANRLLREARQERLDAARKRNGGY